MTKKYYQVEFTRAEYVWATDEDEAYAKARERLQDLGISDSLENYDECVTEEPDVADYLDEDAPEPGSEEDAYAPDEAS